MNTFFSISKVLTGKGMVGFGLLTLTFFANVSAAIATENQQSGRVIYEHVINLHAALSPSQQAMKSMIPKERVSHLELSFTPKSYRLTTKPQDQGAVRTATFDKNNSTLVDIASSMQIRIGEMVGIPYQMQTPVTTLNNIRLQPETTFILELEVKRLTGTATINDKERNVEIWYSSVLPTHFSPFPISGVPGAVLSMTVGEDYWRYAATHISFETIADSEFVVPAGHRMVTPEQLQDLQEEAIDEFRRSGAQVLSSKG